MTKTGHVIGITASPDQHNLWLPCWPTCHYLFKLSTHPHRHICYDMMGLRCTEWTCGRVNYLTANEKVISFLPAITKNHGLPPQTAGWSVNPYSHVIHSCMPNCMQRTRSGDQKYFAIIFQNNISTRIQSNLSALANFQ